MKKMIFVAIALVASAASAAVKGSKHDMSTYVNNGTASACAYCHEPHWGMTGSLAPLWAHKNTAATYTVYTSSTISQAPAQPVLPGRASGACLSCHDGTVATGTITSYVTGANKDIMLASTNNFVGTQIQTGGTANAAAKLGTNLTGDHPISITFNPAAPNAGLATLATVKTAGFVFYGATADQVECQTCHEPHNATANTFGFKDYLGNATLFIRPVTGTDFCSICHSAK